MRYNYVTCISASLSRLDAGNGGTNENLEMDSNELEGDAIGFDGNDDLPRARASR